MRCVEKLVILCVILTANLEITAAQPKIDVQVLQSDADMLMRKHKYHEAIPVFTKVLSVQMKNERVLLKRSKAYLGDRQYEKALHDLDTALQLKPKYKPALMQRATLNKVLGNCETALVDLRKLISLKPNHKDANAMLSDAQTCASLVNAVDQEISRKRFAAAKSVLNQIIDKYASVGTNMILKRCEVNIALKEYFDVIVDSQDILRLDSNNIEAIGYKGIAHMYLGDIDIAKNHFSKCLQNDPENVSCKTQHRLLKGMLKEEKAGDRLIDNSSFQEAAEHFVVARSMDPDNSLFIKKMMMKECKAMRLLGEFKKAESACNDALAIDEGYLDGLIELSEVMLVQDKFEEAVRLLHTAIEHDKENNDLRHRLQKAETALKQSKEKNYYKILGVPRNADKKAIKKAYRALALMWHPDKVEEKDLDRAEKMFQDIGEAYEVLNNEEMRAKYDRGEPVFENQGNQGGGHQHQHRGHPFGGGGGGNFKFN